MKSVLITGGSSGIGFEISKHFVKNGYKTYWVSLFEEEIKTAQQQLLSQYPTAQIEYLVQDLSETQGAQITYNWIKSKNINLDVLINNAGFATFGYSSSISTEKEVKMIELNVLNLYKLTRFFLDEMIERNSGTIINISSNTSFQPVPKMAAYSATKAFVAHYSQSLSAELKALKSKVRVMTVCPAAIKDTKFKVAANMEKVKTFEGLLVTTKEEVAKDVWNAFQRKQDYLLTGRRLRLLNPLNKILPKFIINFLLNRELSEH